MKKRTMICVFAVLAVMCLVGLFTIQSSKIVGDDAFDLAEAKAVIGALSE